MKSEEVRRRCHGMLDKLSDEGVEVAHELLRCTYYWHDDGDPSALSPVECMRWMASWQLRSIEDEEALTAVWTLLSKLEIKKAAPGGTNSKDGKQKGTSLPSLSEVQGRMSR